MNHIRQLGAVAALAMLFALLAGCTASPLRPSVATKTPANAAMSQEGLKARQGLLEQYPDAKLPKVAVISTVSLDDLPKKRAACLTKQGFPMTVTADGGQTGFVPAGQDEAFRIAQYVCIVEYPLEQKYQNPLSDDQFKTLYDYQKTTLTKCLRSHGFDVPRPPSFETFKDTYGNSATWTAYGDVNATGDQWTEINQACPQIPANLFK